MLGVCVLGSDNSIVTRYFHTDNLGSIAVIINESGAVVERDSYDAWGKRRFPNGADDPAGSIESQTTRGFTGQEELADVGLVHLNGRVYDPLVGRMMSADPMVPDPLNAQAWNRYSYVINNPLAFTDPSGYCFLGMCSWGKAISTFFGRTFGVLFRQVPILGTLFEIAAVGLCTVFAGPACAAVAFAATAFVAGVTTGNLSYALKAGLIAGVTALAFYEVGEFTGHTPSPFDADPSKYVENVAGHALVGCASAVASGGKCGPAALAGAVTAGAAPFINGKNFVLNVATNSVLGGLASVAGGGKFANGAITGAFGYLCNACGSDPHGCLKAGVAAGAAMGVYEGGPFVVAGPIGVAVGGLILVTDTVIGGVIGFASDIIGNDWSGAAIYNARPPANAWDPNGPKAPGYPGDPEAGHPDYVDPKGGPNWVTNPNGPGYGWEDRSGDVWVPTGWGGAAHGGPHWDVQTPGGGYRNAKPPQPQ
jgi:RHS repeat-associated protein